MSGEAPLSTSGFKDAASAHHAEDVAVVAGTAEVSREAAALLLAKCNWGIGDALDCFFAGEVTREELEAEAAMEKKEKVPACQFYWNGFCPKGDRCLLRHGDDESSSVGGSENRNVLFTGNTDEMDYEELIALGDSMGKVVTPVAPCVRKCLRIKSPKEADPADTCAICIDALSASPSTVTELPCKHTFHTACIDQWMDTSKYCPVCKAEIVVTKVAPPPKVSHNMWGQFRKKW